MITVSHLTKTYGGSNGFRAVDDVTFTAQPGRVTGFLGPNGAGKSTTMRIMVGLTPATSGEATILDRHYSDRPSTPAAPGARSSPSRSAPCGCPRAASTRSSTWSA